MCKVFTFASVGISDPHLQSDGKVLFVGRMLHISYNVAIISEQCTAYTRLDPQSLFGLDLPLYLLAETLFHLLHDYSLLCLFLFIPETVP